MSKPTSTILITGGTSGLGYECALSLARQKPDSTIIIASRTNTDNASAKINSALHQTNVTYLPLDLSSLANIRTFASTYSSSSNPPISALVLNAGLQFPSSGPTYTSDGVEKTFAINHVGHALLFYLLRPHLAPTARIVVVSSGTHDPAQKSGLPDAFYNSAEELAHPTTPESAKLNGRQRYATSKLCNVLWTYALHDHITRSASSSASQSVSGSSAAGGSSKNWTVTAFDPGLMPGTGLAREAGPVLRFLFTSVLPHLIWLLRRLLIPNTHSPAESGMALARLAVGNDVEGVSGKYFEGLREIPSSKDSYDKGKQEELWRWTARFVAEGNKEEERAFERLE